MDVYAAARRGDADFLESYARSGGDLNRPDHNGMTLLHLAIDNGRTGVVRWLIGRRVQLNGKDKWGQTALMLAAGRNDAESVRLLVAGRADLALTAVNGLTALGYALDNGHRETAAFLRRAGAK